MPNPPSRRGALAALLVLLLLVVVALFMARELGGASRIQDCVMQGRSNCAPLR